MRYPNLIQIEDTNDKLKTMGYFFDQSQFGKYGFSDFGARMKARKNGFEIARSSPIANVDTFHEL